MVDGSSDVGSDARTIFAYVFEGATLVTRHNVCELCGCPRFFTIGSVSTFFYEGVPHFSLCEVLGRTRRRALSLATGARQGLGLVACPCRFVAGWGPAFVGGSCLASWPSGLGSDRLWPVGRRGGRHRDHMWYRVPHTSGSRGILLRRQSQAFPTLSIRSGCCNRRLLCGRSLPGLRRRSNACALPSRGSSERPFALCSKAEHQTVDLPESRGTTLPDVS